VLLQALSHLPHSLTLVGQNSLQTSYISSISFLQLLQHLPEPDSVILKMAAVCFYNTLRLTKPTMYHKNQKAKIIGNFSM